MHTQVYINIATRDMARSQAFWRELGYEFNPQFTNEHGACLVLGENLYAMLLTEPFFSGFTSKAIADAKTCTEVLICLNCSSREEVDSLVAKAVAAGGTAPRAPQDHGFMYGHGFEDLDGHIWELAYMNTSAAANPERDA